MRSTNDEFHIEMAYLGHLNSLKADLTARENLRFLAGLRETLDGADIDAALDRVGHPVARRPARPARCRRARSGGWRWPGCCSRAPCSGSWTSRSPTWTSAGVDLVEDLVREHVGRGGLALAAAHQRLLDDAPFLRRLELQLMRAPPRPPPPAWSSAAT